MLKTTILAGSLPILTTTGLVASELGADWLSTLASGGAIGVLALLVIVLTKCGSAERKSLQDERIAATAEYRLSNEAVMTAFRTSNENLMAQVLKLAGVVDEVQKQQQNVDKQ